MAVLCEMPAIQYSARSDWLSVHKLFTSCIRRGLVSRDSIVDDDWLPATEWCQRYLPSCHCQPASDVPKNLEYIPCMDCSGQGNDFGLIPTVKMETRNPVEGYFSREFPRSVIRVTAPWSRKTLNIFENFCVFWKTTPYSKIFKTLFRKFSSLHRSTCCVQISWNLADRKSEIVRCLSVHKFCMALQAPAVATARIAPKIYHGQSPIMYSECSRFQPNGFTFGGVIAQRVNTAKTRRKVNTIFGWNLASSRINILVQWCYLVHWQKIVAVAASVKPTQWSNVCPVWRLEQEERLVMVKRYWTRIMSSQSSHSLMMSSFVTTFGYSSLSFIKFKYLFWNSYHLLVTEMY